MTRILEWTGHPLVDVGIATVCAVAGKNDPGELTLEDLDVAAGEMKESYRKADNSTPALAWRIPIEGTRSDLD